MYYKTFKYTNFYLSMILLILSLFCGMFVICDNDEKIDAAGGTIDISTKPNTLGYYVDYTIILTDLTTNKNIYYGVINSKASTNLPSISVDSGHKYMLSCVPPAGYSFEISIVSSNTFYLNTNICIFDITYKSNYNISIALETKSQGWFTDSKVY